MVNIVFEFSDHFSDGRYADHASAFTVMNWLVTILKAIGAVVALLSIARPSRHIRPSAITVVIWGAFATLTVYALGSVAQAIGMAAGLTGSVDDIDLAGIAYVMFFLLAAGGFGVLAVSYSRRHRMPARLAVLGVLGAPLLLGLVLVVVPALLTAVGLMPSE
ncbi:hypothetical protein E1212_12885 [Jiangella ureilytica]|uniref:Uncharacterized protein n=1 Tax=Jiangella ureilytica TaxID=2530374 RepID=A0A4V2XWX5_9ACTN|nr:hypothetical protein [Jiangella ureilytica]TDC51045.1 hypothetical protein E1212_12885 [Jiangella ureilytica]